MTANAVARPMTSAERAREFRRRRREKLRILTIELREAEVEAMVAASVLCAEQRHDTGAVIAALYRVLDRAFAALEAGALPEVKPALRKH